MQGRLRWIRSNGSRVLLKGIAQDDSLFGGRIPEEIASGRKGERWKPWWFTTLQGSKFCHNGYVRRGSLQYHNNTMYCLSVFPRKTNASTVDRDCRVSILPPWLMQSSNILLLLYTFLLFYSTTSICASDEAGWTIGTRVCAHVVINTAMHDIVLVHHLLIQVSSYLSRPDRIWTVFYFFLWVSNAVFFFADFWHFSGYTTVYSLPCLHRYRVNHAIHPPIIVHPHIVRNDSSNYPWKKPHMALIKLRQRSSIRASHVHVSLLFCSFY